MSAARLLGVLALVFACSAGTRTAFADDARLEPVQVSAPCPAIPDASQVELSLEEWQRVEAGEIVVRVVREGDEISRAQAIGFLDANPLWLFDLATDSDLAPEIVDQVKRVDVQEISESGKLATGHIKATRLLPTFRYTYASHYLPSHTGQCWGQVEGDFSRNEGAHSFLWDPARSKTLAIFSFTIGMKGLLSLIPERLVLQGAADTLPSFMRSLETMRPIIASNDPVRARRVDEEWARMRPRLEAGEFPGRLWLGYIPVGEASLAQTIDSGEITETR